MPVYYCAGYQEEEGERVYPYNLTKLLYHILSGIPAEKRAAVMEGIDLNNSKYLYNDEEEDYSEAVRSSFMETLDTYIWYASMRGEDIGEKILGIPGRLAGKVVGGFIGIFDGLFRAAFES